MSTVSPPRLLQKSARRGTLFPMERQDIIQYALPDTPGVYLFRDSRKRILYVGKATSLRERVRSYFAADLSTTRGERISTMVREARSVSWHETDSVLEALILEAALIKEHQPPANVRERDNKSFNYLVITKEPYPRVLVVRGRELFLTWDTTTIAYTFGPFPQGKILKEALGIVRKIFPFRDTCTPHSGKPCFNAQLQLCPGVCTGVVTEVEYAQTIQDIVLLFKGKKKELLRRLTCEMRRAAQEELFEYAARIRAQIYALTHIRDIALIKRDSPESTGGRVLRMEAYDVAHTAGSHTVGVCVAFANGEPDTSGYRKFKINSVGNNDAGALRELLERRLAHPEWAYPDLIVVDGGDIQYRVAQEVLAAHQVTIPIVAVVKDEHHRARGFLGEGSMLRMHEITIKAANAEAHRYAVRFHRTRRDKVI